MTTSFADNILLVGFTSSGKSTTGRRLAELLELSFVDLDDIVEMLHVEERGHRRRCREIFDLLGRECFVGYERAALDHLKGKGGQVIALGGGTPVDEDNRRRIVHLGKVVYLRAAPITVLDRMKHKGFPRFLGDAPTLEVLEGFWRSRHEIYKDIADVVVDNSSLSPEETALAIIDRLDARAMLGAAANRARSPGPR
jgi:shikimate kinase